LGAVVAIFLGRPVWHVVSTALRDVDQVEKIPPGFTDDASRLNRTKVADVVRVETDPVAAERQLAALLARARDEGLHVSIAGTRHSMGGHTIYPGGIVIDMLPFHQMELDEEHDILHVQAGARWGGLLPYLVPHRAWLPASHADTPFSAGGPLGVTGQGWQSGRPPIASTVDSFRLMPADGSIVRCSRDENSELFSLALGGYGLFGIILDA